MDLCDKTTTTTDKKHCWYNTTRTTCFDLLCAALTVMQDATDARVREAIDAFVVYLSEMHMHTQVAIVRDEIREATESAELIIGPVRMELLMQPHWKEFDDLAASYNVQFLTRVRHNRDDRMQNKPPTMSTLKGTQLQSTRFEPSSNTLPAGPMHPSVWQTDWNTYACST